MSKNHMNRSEFNEEGAESVGGVTGSKKVESKGIFYQLKPSILAASFMRRFKAGGVERENFGEVLAAQVSRSLTKTDTGPELVPKVILVNDEKNKQTLIASRYLNNVEKGNLDDYAIKGRGVEVPGRHVKVTGNPTPGRGELSIGGTSEADKLLRQDLAKAIAVSALSGDHDVNPGNMMAVKDTEGRTRIARIDFGHAFNDLIRTSRLFGGIERNKDNRILDFVNRETVEHLNPRNRETKLWKNYSGIVPSEEMAQAFKEIGESKNLKTGVDKALKHFEGLITELEKKPKENKEQLNHIKESLIAISANVSQKEIDPKLSPKQALAQVGKNLTEFYEKGQAQMLQVSELMEMQVKVDKLIARKAEGYPANNLEQEIAASYKKIEQYKGISQGKGKGIEWVKNDKDTKAFKGDLESFIKDRNKALGHNKSVALVASAFAKPAALAKEPTKLAYPKPTINQKAEVSNKKSDKVSITDSMKKQVHSIMKPASSQLVKDANKNTAPKRPPIDIPQKASRKTLTPSGQSGRGF